MIQTLFGPPPPTLRERFQKAVESTRSALNTNVEDLVQGKELKSMLAKADSAAGYLKNTLQRIIIRYIGEIITMYNFN